MHAVITGATGMLGRHLATQLSRQGWTITAIIRETSNRSQLNLPGIQFHICDLSRDDLDPEWLRHTDVVFHAAAVVTDWAPWPFFVANTIEPTERVCRAMLAADCRRLVHISTVGVYGRPRLTEPIREDQPYTSIGRWDYYTNAKIEAERIVWRHHRAHDLEVTVLRPAMIYGPGDRGLIARVIPLLSQGKIVFAGDPATCLPLVHVEDVANAAARAATTPAAIGEAFNIVNPEPVTQREFFNTIATKIGALSVQRCTPYRLAYTMGFAAEIFARAWKSPRPPFITRYRVSLFGHRRAYAIDKARATLGWEPQTPFRDGIESAVQSSQGS